MSWNADKMTTVLVKSNQFIIRIVDSINENTVSIKLGREPTKGNSEITVNAYPAKSGESKGGLINVITADGKMLGKPLSEAGEGPAIK